MAVAGRGVACSTAGLAAAERGVDEGARVGCSMSGTMSVSGSLDGARLLLSPAVYSSAGHAASFGARSGKSRGRIFPGLCSSFMSQAGVVSTAESGASPWEPQLDSAARVRQERETAGGASTSRSSFAGEAGVDPTPAEQGGGQDSWSAGLAIAAALGAASSTVVKVVRPQQGCPSPDSAIFSAPSEDFVALCQAQLELCALALAPGDNLTVYVRTPESYTTGQLELRCVACHPESHSGARLHDIILLVSDIEAKQAGRTAETAVVAHEAIELPERGGLVLPLAKGSFLVGLLVVERCSQSSTPKRSRPLAMKAVRPAWPPSNTMPFPPSSTASNRIRKGQVSSTSSEKGVVQLPNALTGSQMQGQATAVMRRETISTSIFTAKEQAEAAKVAQTLALACVLDQRALLIQQSAWQKAALMDSLLGEVRAPLVAFRALGHMLLPQLRQGELSKDIVEGMIIQGDRMKDVFDKLQQAVYPTQGTERLATYESPPSSSGLESPQKCDGGREQSIMLQQLLPLPTSPVLLPGQQISQAELPSLGAPPKNEERQRSNNQ